MDYWTETPDSSYLRVEASLVARNLCDRLPLGEDDVVFDFGCGYGYVAEDIADHVCHVYLWDTVDHVREEAERRIGRANVAVASSSDLAGTRSIDFVLCNSVVQYMDEATLATFLALWKGFLADDGAIVIADVITAEPSLLGESLNWFRLTARHGQLLDSICFGLQNARRYADARTEEPLHIYTEARSEAITTSIGFLITREPENFAFQPARSTFVLSPAWSLDATERYLDI